MAEPSMIERVAKAIYMSRNGHGAKPWSLLPIAHKTPYLDDARAAIEAMREIPYGAAWEAAEQTEIGTTSDIQKVWRIIIDAILKEGD